MNVIRYSDAVYYSVREANETFKSTAHFFVYHYPTPNRAGVELGARRRDLGERWDLRVRTFCRLCAA